MPRSALAYARLIEDALRGAAGPLSAAGLAETLAETGIGIATVYRHLNRGVEEGRFAAVELPGGPTRYEPAGRPHHHHFACTGCDAVYDVPGCPGNLEALVPEGFTLASHEIVFEGLCSRCGGAGNDGDAGQGAAA